MREIHRLIVHHSASPRDVTTAQIRQWHVERNGWSDIGYHYVIEGDGALVVGRPFPQQGAHAKGANQDSIGVCVVGDNTVPGRGWTEPQVAALLRLVFACRTLWPSIRVVGHRQAGVTETKCPGVELGPLLGDFSWL